MLGFNPVASTALAAPTASTALFSTDVTSLTTLSSPSIGQNHVLLTTSVESFSSFSQKNTLLSTSVTSTSSLTNPVITQTHVLSSENVAATSTTSSPRIDVESGTIDGEYSVTLAARGSMTMYYAGENWYKI